MTTYTLRRGAADKTGADVVVAGVVDSGKGPRLAPGAEAIADAYGRKLTPLLSTLGFTAKAGQVTAIPTGGLIKSPLLVLVGLGKDEALSTDRIRRAAGAAARAINNAATVAVALPAESPDEVRAVVEGFMLGGYAFSTYKSAPAKAGPVNVMVLTEGARRADLNDALALAQTVVAAVVQTRDWVNTPPGDFTPNRFADAVVARNTTREGAKVSVKVMDETDLEKAGCGGILGVGAGSASPPRLVRLTYKPKGATKHIALVGKGITYDSGGLSIKPSTSMSTMKMDMAGAAAVVSATYAIADLGLPIAVTAFAPMAENMISGAATRPGDVLKMYGGKTVEVLNTDAEGRLILADALVHANEVKADLVIDVATLTGACVMALGDRVTGLLGNDDDLIAQIRAAADRAGEAVWPLPIPDEMGEKVRGNSKIADLAQHNTDRWGGALYAAAFLREFVGDQPWAHLDIAGPAFNERAAYGHVTPGGTGVAVATLIELARTLSAEE